MNFICTQENLLKALTQVAPITGRNTQLPVLQHVLLQVKDNVLHVTGTDLEIGVHSIIGGKIKTEGACTVPARKLLDYVQQLPNKNPIEIEVKDGRLFVLTEGFKAQFSTSDAEEFPILPSVDTENPIVLDAKRFCSALSDVLFAASREEARPEIRSVYIQIKDGELRVAATDSFRLGERVIENIPDTSFQCILPLLSAQEVIRLFSEQEMMQILPHENHVSFQCDDLEFSSRLVDGNYPDYKQIIPKDWKTSISVSKTDLLRALKTLSVFLPKDSRRVQVIVALKKSDLHLRVAGSETGEGDVHLTVKGEGDDLDILLNIQYLIEGIQHIGTPDCVMCFNGGGGPVIIKPSGKAQGYVYVVMPIQV